MKIRRRYIALLFIALFLAITLSSQLIPNAWGLLVGNGYVIPKESSIFRFKVTQMNEGSGDYWLYAEDENFFYSQMIGDENASYVKISREESLNPYRYAKFDKFNIKTWSIGYLCGDLLDVYAEKPEKLEFVECKTYKSSQSRVVATYRVSGKDAAEVEAFFVEKYGMGELKWACCGWETSGKNGSFKHPELTAISPYLSAIITMFASAEVDYNEEGLELDRTKIEYFTVEVNIAYV